MMEATVLNGTIKAAEMFLPRSVLVTILFLWSIDNYMDYKALFVLDYTANYTETGVCLNK